MAEGPHILVSLDPFSASAVLRVAGPLPATSLNALQLVLDRAVAMVGPQVTIDLTDCIDPDPAVTAYVMSAAKALRARRAA